MDMMEELSTIRRVGEDTTVPQDAMYSLRKTMQKRYDIDPGWSELSWKELEDNYLRHCQRYLNLDVLYIHSLP